MGGYNCQGASENICLDSGKDGFVNIWFGGWLKRSVSGVVGWVFVSEKTI